MITYIPDPIGYPSKKYTISYQELREMYYQFLELSDDDFKKRIAEIFHLATIICYLKEVSSDVLLNDVGLLHLFVHQLALPDDSEDEFKMLREAFKIVCKLD